MNSLSVIICTYNPSPYIFKNCLEALAVACSQFPPGEVVIVDNNSARPVSEEPYVAEFLSRHPDARVVSEKKQGLTSARLRGIRETTGNVLVFIDDDNWISPGFLKKGMETALAHPHIGAWSGQVKLAFESQPAAWTRRYWGLLVHREFNQDAWSNLPHLFETMPCGAGLFARRKVAELYQLLHETGLRAINLDRTADSLFSSGDNDLAACACDLGLGVGLFHELELTHYIPEKRLNLDYLLKLAEEITASSIVFRSFRDEFPPGRTVKNRLADAMRLVIKKPVARKFHQAVLRGEKKGKAYLASIKNQN